MTMKCAANARKRWYATFAFVLVCTTAFGFFYTESVATISTHEGRAYVSSRDFSAAESLPSRLRYTDSQLNEMYPVRTKFNNSRVVFYNRVSKCGSTTMVWTLRRLTQRRSFRLQDIDHHNIYSTHAGNVEEFIATTVARRRHDSLSVTQLPHVNFTKFGLEYPLYINVVRDPADRSASTYYFSRFGFKKRNGTVNENRPRVTFTDEERDMNINDCILRKGMECIKHSLPSLAFFCGFSNQCRERSEYAMQQSKLNVAKYYAVVGLLEDIPNTLKVLEAVLPRYFKNVEDIYFSSPEINGSKTYRKDSVSPEVRSRLRHMLSYEYEFYEFVKHRFYRQLDELKRENRIS